MAENNLPETLPDAILFDWDGTLADSFALLEAAYAHMAEHFSVPPLSREEVILNTRRGANEIFAEMFGDRAVEASRVFYAYITQNQLAHMSPKMGAVDLLDVLHRRNIPMGIVSNMGHEMLLENVAELGWDRFFGVVLGAGQAARNKPAPDPLVLACERLSIDPSERIVWYVGDTETDMMAAEAAGIVPVLIGHGARNLADCQRVGITPYFSEGFGPLLQKLQF